MTQLPVPHNGSEEIWAWQRTRTGLCGPGLLAKSSRQWFPANAELEMRHGVKWWPRVLMAFRAYAFIPGPRIRAGPQNRCEVQVPGLWPLPGANHAPLPLLARWAGQ